MNNNFTLYIKEKNISITPIFFDSSTKTAKDAADSLGCQVSQIAKSICFWSDQAPLLVIASGSNRISLQKLQDIAQTKIKIMSAKEIQKTLGYTIGGVPPFGYSSQPQTIIDQDLFQYEVIYAAAGAPNAVFKTTPQDLEKLSHAQIKDIKE